MSDGLYKSLEEATKTEHVNIDIAQMTVEQVDFLIWQYNDLYVKQVSTIVYSLLKLWQEKRNFSFIIQYIHI